MAVKGAGGGFLHVPNKSWVGVEGSTVGGHSTSMVTPDNVSKWAATKEKQNYDELERWSQRIPRGIISWTQQPNPLVLNNGDSTYHTYISSAPFQIELGRVYRIEAFWPYIQSTSDIVSDEVNFQIGVNAVIGSGVFLSPLLVMNIPDGGTLPYVFVPSRTGLTPGLYTAILEARWAGGTSATITIGATSSIWGWISVEDLGIWTLATGTSSN